MYQVDPPLPVEELDAGIYYVTGPPLSQMDRLIRELVAGGIERGENALLVSADSSVVAIQRSYGDLLEPLPERVGLIDCISEQSGGAEEERPQVSYVSSPGDLTGIGMYASRHLQRFAELGQSNRTRVTLNSVSTLLMYEDFRTVVRFLHVFGSRLDVADALGLFVLNDRTHDTQVVENILELADGVIEVREGDRSLEVRVVSAGTASDWQPF